MPVAPHTAQVMVGTILAAALTATAPWVLPSKPAKQAVRTGRITNARAVLELGAAAGAMLWGFGAASRSAERERFDLSWLMCTRVQ
jgi:hypothetical protein